MLSVKSKILNSIIILLVGVVYSQTIKGDFSFPAEPFHQEEIDQSLYQVFYEFEYIPNLKHKDKKRKGVTLLQVGASYLKFADANTYQLDSLKNKFQDLKQLGAKEINQMLAYRSVFPYTIYLDQKAGAYTLNNKLSHSFAYTEPLPHLDWKIGTETKKIGDYTVIKASTKYAGRNYEAWFTRDIPLNYGPYIFNGLPGLILEIRDDEDDYAFVMVKIEKIEKPITKGYSKAPIEVTRKKYRELERTYYENPSQFIKGMAVNADGTPIKTKLKSRPYNPIELE